MSISEATSAARIDPLLEAISALDNREIFLTPEWGNLADLCRSQPSEDEAREILDRFIETAASVAWRLEQVERRVAYASHDLGTPLFVLMSAASSLRHEVTDDAGRNQLMDTILRSVRSLQYLVEDLQDTVRCQAGQLNLHRSTFDLAALAREAVEDYLGLLQSHRILFEGDEVWVEGDRERLKRAIFNLLSNAVKYSQAGTVVQVEVWPRGQEACLFVHDQGKGISAADSDRLFLPFTRLQCDGSGPAGDGLGLAAVKQIVEAHGASVMFQGQPGAGTTFEICLKSLARPNTFQR